MRTRARIGVALAAAVSVAVPIASASAQATPKHAALASSNQVKHVLLISVDGMHQSDLQWYVKQNPTSTLAKLVAGSAEFTDAHTPIPSDSFPGMVGIATGGDPGVTGIYYDDTYNYDLDAPGTTNCATATPGTTVNLDESIDKNSSSLDAGAGLGGLPGSILSMTSTPQTLIDPTQLPVDPTTCKPVYPNQYLKVNTIFNVAHDAGLRTAWSDKHPAYTILDGPEGNGVDDFFTPEINSDALTSAGVAWTGGDDWTQDNAATEQYDTYKVQAVINEIDGYNHQGTTKVGVPAIFGMNFQTLSTAQKLTTSDGFAGGYEAGSDTPGPLLARALDYVNTELTAMTNAITAQGLWGSMAIILTSKHGQSPIDPSKLVRIDDSVLVSNIDAAWKAAHPSDTTPLIAADTDDDAIMMWLSDRSQAAAEFVSSYLMNHSATGNQLVCTTAAGCSTTYQNVTVQHSGLVKVYAGQAAANYFHVSAGDPRHPDVWGVVQVGVVYTGGHSKIAEHGGANVDDRDVPLFVFAPGRVRSWVYNQTVETTQVAPTVLELLGLNPSALAAVRIEGTQVLPGINGRP